NPSDAKKNPAGWTRRVNEATPSTAATCLLYEMKHGDNRHAPPAEQQWQIRITQSVPTKERRRRGPNQRQTGARESNPDASVDHSECGFHVIQVHSGFTTVMASNKASRLRQIIRRRTSSSEDQAWCRAHESIEGIPVNEWCRIDNR